MASADSDDAARRTDSCRGAAATDGKGRQSGERESGRAKITLKWLRDKAQIICDREQQGYSHDYTRNITRRDF